MVQASDYDLISRRKGPPDGPAEAEGEAGHVRTKNNLLGARSVEQVGHGPAGGIDGLVGAPAVQKGAVEVAVCFGQVAIHGLNDRAMHLSAAWTIKKDERPSSVGLLDCREFGPQCGNRCFIQCHLLLLVRVQAQPV